MEMTFQAAKLLENIPQGLGAWFTIFLLVVGLWFKYKKNEQEERKLEHDTHKQLVETLNAQVKTLNEQLEATRIQMNELHSQNLVLMTQLRESNRRIVELETKLSMYTDTLAKK